MLEGSFHLKILHHQVYKKYSKGWLTNQEIFELLKIPERKFYRFLKMGRWPLSVKKFVLENEERIPPSFLLELASREWARPRQLLSAVKGKIEETSKQRRPKKLSGYRKIPVSRKQLAGQIHEKSVDEMRKQSVQSDQSDGRQPSFLDLDIAEDRLRNLVQSRVEIAGGDIRIKYFSLEQLQGILEKLEQSEQKSEDPLSKIREQQELSLEQLMSGEYKT